MGEHLSARDYRPHYHRRQSRRMLTALALTGACAAAALLLFLQPWVSCDYEDTSVGCASTPLVAGLLMAAVAGTGAGLLITLGLALSRDAEDAPMDIKRLWQG